MSSRQMALSGILSALAAAFLTMGGMLGIATYCAPIQAMAALTMSEAQVENLVTAKGYGDCVCFINDSSASVVVSSTENGLNENDVTKIMEIVKEETGLSASKITVIETEP